MLLTVRGRLASLDIEARLSSAGVMRATAAEKANHAVLNTFLTARGSLAAPEVGARYLRAGVVICETPAANGYHVVLGVLHAVHPIRPALNVEGRSFRAGVVRATLADDVHHALFSVFLAVLWRLAPLEVKVRFLRAGIMRATPDAVN